MEYKFSWRFVRLQGCSCKSNLEPQFDRSFSRSIYRGKGKLLKCFSRCLHLLLQSTLGRAKSVGFLPTRNKETQCRNAFRACFYGLLQIPLEDFTSNVRWRWKRKRQACRGGVDNRRFQYLESKKTSAPLPRDRVDRRQCDIYFPSTKRRNATRTAIRC